MPTLEFSATVPIIDPISGYSTKTGDTTRLYVGSVLTDAGSLFTVLGTGWLNPIIISGTQTGVPVYSWCDINTKFRIKATSLPTSDTDGIVVGTQV